MLTATNLPPVRDVHGHAVWRVRVAPGEMTCTGCGETATGDFCQACGTDETGQRRVENPPPLVPTLSYLRDNEWESV